jgi:tungstate transport system permease protein
VAEILLALPVTAALTAAAVQGTDPRVLRAALTLGAGPARALWAVAREARAGLAAAVVVAFGRVISEVGAALIVGGNIRHETRTLTTAVMLATSQGQFELAMALGLVLLALALTINGVILLLQGRPDV